MSKASILIVEDEAIVAENLTSKLARMGNHVAGIAAKGREAVEMALELKPELILMDINLRGDLDGIQAAQAIREQQDIPVIYLTAHSDPVTLDRAKLTGPFGYILKPFEMRDLETQIELALHKHQLERKLRDQREWFQVTLSSIGDAVIATDEDGKINFLNGVAEELTGWSTTEAAGRPLKDIFHIIEEQTRKPGEDPVQRVMQTGTVVGLKTQTLLLRRDGREVPIDDSGAPIRDEQGRIIGVVLVFRDITERRQIQDQQQRLQEQLNQAQKMESVGRLAGGVAHDFNNMLGIIIGHTDLIKMILEKEQPGSALQSDLDQIMTAAQRSADLTRQLLGFARKQPILPVVLDLNVTISNMIKMLQRLVGEEINFHWKPGENLWSVKIDPSQTDQLLANLCVNARDAIEGVGNITIETANIPADDIFCAQHPECTAGDYVMLAVSDDGQGMDQETLKNLFEPFFTTKKIGEGTGLGLAMVYGIVKQNDGFIDVYSEPGIGAVFKIYLPRTGEASSARLTTDLRVMQGGHETVLVVEDEKAILNLAKSVLERLGYNVIAVQSPTQAIQIAATHRPPIDLLITDVIMPEMNGQQLRMEIRKRLPDTKVIFMTGYTADAIALRGVGEHDVRLLQKPFSISSLARKVREILDQGLHR